ncbi:DUF2066 domain-containing protein [Salinimonas sediminis]|uniref:DUF2066 domain-containing protein n=1 Tax=Salinimonas sediminis TaxID=2303538 RepID=A0A346NMP5_9ALTE|nr:DUF2066 domain-containing protein [Salinimonas sediminis]AXR06802.1 DUF2066 domain-containing protein [Salinimonas sediminis]
MLITKNLVSFSSFICTLLMVGVLLSSPVGRACASSLVETNSAKVEVANQGANARKQAQTEALKRVFTKMTGSAQTLDNAGVKAALRNPGKYLIAYQYTTDNDTLYYDAQFSRDALTALLKREKLPLWGQRRPDTLFWLATEQNDQRWIMREGQPDALRYSLLSQSQRRAVPISLPLMDLTDNTAINVYDVWAQFSGTLRKASARYNPDYILSARLYQQSAQPAPDFLTTEEKLERALSQSAPAFAYQQTQQQNAAEDPQDEFSDAADAEPNTANNESNLEIGDSVSDGRGNPEQTVNSLRPDASVEPTMIVDVGEGEYALEWLLLETGSTQFGTVRAASPEQALAGLMDVYADYLAARFSVRFTGQQTADNELVISVANLDSLTHYIHAQKFLSQLSVVDSAILTAQKGPVATFNLKLVGTRDDFFNALSFESRLRPVKDSFGQALEGNNFYWNE